MKRANSDKLAQSTWLAVSLDRASSEPLHRQLYRAARQRILAGVAPPDAAMPSTRAFAAELGVARSTVVAAYEQLQGEGYVEGRHGAGVFVAKAADLARAAPMAAPRTVAPAPAKSSALAAFRPGVPDMRLFPHARWNRIAAAALRREGSGLVGGGDPFGLLSLRLALARHLAEWRGLVVDPADLVITAGAAGALDLVFDTLTRPGDLIGLENPGYPVVRAMAEQRALRTVPITVDGAGFQVDALRALNEPPRMVVVTPSNQFPLGVASPVGRRTDLLAWASEVGAVIVEDDYDSEFRFGGRPIPALAAAPGQAQVAYVGTLSKVFSPGLRIGYVALPPVLTPAARLCLERMGPRVSLMPQAPLADFIASGEFGRHLRRMRRVYAERRHVLLALLRETFGQGLLTVSERDAGMHVVVRFGGRLAELRDVEAAHRAAAVGVRVDALSRFYFGGSAEQGLMLGFAGFEVSEMRAAALALKDALIA